MGNISQVGYGHPQFKVFKLGGVGDLLRDVDASFEADPVKLILTELVYDLEGHEFILLPQFVKIEIQGPGDDNFSKLPDDRSINRYLQLYYLQDIIYDIQPCHRSHAHEMRYMQQCLHIEILELSILFKQEPELKQVCGELVLTPQDML